MNLTLSLQLNENDCLAQKHPKIKEALKQINRVCEMALRRLPVEASPMELQLVLQKVWKDLRQREEVEKMEEEAMNAYLDDLFDYHYKQAL